MRFIMVERKRYIQVRIDRIDLSRGIGLFNAFFVSISICYSVSVVSFVFSETYVFLGK